MMGSRGLEPEEGMEFESHEAAYAFYKDYAKSAGFGTAKLSSRRSRSSKEFIDAKFSCIRYGSKQHSDDALNPRPSPKIGCRASMHVKRRPSSDSSLWYVHSFVADHNHDLLPHQSHFFRSHRGRNASRRGASSSSAAAATISSSAASAAAATPPLADWIRPDDSRSLPLDPQDSQLLVRRLAALQDHSPGFFYALDFNRHHRLRNAFWADAGAARDFPRLRDAVSLDTSRSVAACGRRVPLALFLGVNHHLQPVLLGCALLADDTVYTFAWLMQTWLVAMGGVAPAVILTDQSTPAVKAAAAAVFPASRHFFSLWHIAERLPDEQAEFLGGTWRDAFMEKFGKCAYESWSEEQFEKRWWKLTERFNLGQLEWARSLYDDRAHWSPAFTRGISLAGLSTRTRSESPNSFFDKYVPRDTLLSDFMDRYRVILEDRDEAEARANFDTWHETPELKSPSPFEKQTSLVYTHEVFKRFQAEVLGAAACHLKKESEEAATATATYAVKDIEDDQSYTVEWDEPRSEIRCLCRSFEFKGYLCRHAIVVLQMSGVFNIPPKYVLQRWTNAATSKHPMGQDLEDLQRKTRRYNDLCRRAIILGEEGSLSAESYNVALRAVKEALKQCTSFSVSDEKRPGAKNQGTADKNPVASLLHSVEPELEQAPSPAIFQNPGFTTNPHDSR